MARFVSYVLATITLAASIKSVLAIPGPGTVAFPFTKKWVSAEDVPRLNRRQSGTVLAGLDNEIALYLINITVGTPPQAISLQIDTGSSDIWFPAVNADVCPSQCPVGTYDYSKSSTYADPGLPQFDIAYVDGSQVSGAYISDDLNIGSTKVTNMTMAAATRIDATGAGGVGILGVGFTSGETLASQGITYPNLLDVLQSQGLINARAYSLWLDDQEANTGSVLFGGVDTDKYKGELVSLPIQIDTDSQSISSFTVAWTGLTVTGSGNNADLSPSTPQPAILDSGTSITLLPDEIANNIFNGVGVQQSRDFGGVVHCALRQDDLTFSFTFGGEGGAVLNVSIAEFVNDITTQDGSIPQFEDGSGDACSFGIQAAGSDPILFGDTLLRSAYVVYDLDNNQVGLAQTNFDAQSGSGNVEVFSSGTTAGIPGATRTASGATVAQTASGNPRVQQSTGVGSESTLAAGGSATFHLSATGSATGGGSSATGNAAARLNIETGAVQGQTWFVTAVVLASFVLGGGLVLR